MHEKIILTTKLFFLKVGRVRKKTKGRNIFTLLVNLDFENMLDRKNIYDLIFGYFCTFSTWMQTSF